MPDIIEEKTHLIHHWWMFLLSGTGMVAFSIYVIVNQTLTYDQISIIFAALLFTTGLLELAFCILNRKWFSGWGWYLTGAILDMVLAVIFFTNSILAAISLPFLAGFWLLIRSAVMIGRSVHVKKSGHPEWPWLLFWAVTGSFFSIINIYNPVFGEERLMIWTAAALFTVGIFYLHFGWLIRNRVGWLDMRKVK
ncbi:DUF308 domain-containing protein [Dyadobacter sp. CY345]|uniref:HdeD family acid-resistance protein n=1 Tax=Dyadobacter sp. CY345 TaxID=2909335 RepID=UPI001F2A7A1C|nr:DUF308 domain-containing protein [Dyadobacter sp. CY345]MCF2444030.1 DUF308 domain-containing protein [Dyadobacter sp. CY345]